MYFGPLSGAIICHFLLLLFLGINNKKILTAIGDEEYRYPLSTTSTTSFIAGILFRFVPTFTIMCTGYASVAAAYESEVIGYLFVALPVGYVIIILFFWVSGACETCYEASRNIFPSAQRSNSTSDDQIQRNIRKEQMKNRSAVNNIFSSSLRGSNSDYYNRVPVLSRSIQHILESERAPPILVDREDGYISDREGCDIHQQQYRGLQSSRGHLREAPRMAMRSQGRMGGASGEWGSGGDGPQQFDGSHVMMRDVKAADGAAREYDGDYGPYNRYPYNSVGGRSGLPIVSKEIIDDVYSTSDDNTSE